MWASQSPRAAIERALAKDHNILLCYKGEKAHSGYSLGELAPVATLCHMNNFMRYPDNSVRIAVEGVVTAKLLEVHSSGSGAQMANFKVATSNFASGVEQRKEKTAGEKSFCDHINGHKRGFF